MGKQNPKEENGSIHDIKLVVMENRAQRINFINSMMTARPIEIGGGGEDGEGDKEPIFSSCACMDERDLFRIKEGEPRHVFRSPGSFLLSVAYDFYDLGKMLEAVRENLAEVTSHDGCGTAGLVTAMLRDPEQSQAVRESLLAITSFIGEEDKEFIGNFSRFINKIITDQSISSDELGMWWSQAVAIAADIGYSHLEIDHPEHYASVAIIDVDDLLAGHTDGEVAGNRAFVISNPRHMGIEPKEGVFYDQIMATYGALAAKIARGPHSILGEDKPFTVIILTNNNTNVSEIEEVLAAQLEGVVADVEVLRQSDLSH